jgi:hypothetical protein
VAIRKKKDRITTSLYVGPYLVLDGTLGECIREFLAKPASQHHLYEIHTTPQSEFAVLSAERIIQIPDCGIFFDTPASESCHARGIDSLQIARADRRMGKFMLPQNENICLPRPSPG